MEKHKPGTTPKGRILAIINRQQQQEPLPTPAVLEDGSQAALLWLLWKPYPARYS
jgi:hypothetical protein